MTDGLILALILSGMITYLAYRLRSQGAVFIASLGWLICALQIWQQTEEPLPMILTMMVAFLSFFIIKKERD